MFSRRRDEEKRWIKCNATQYATDTSVCATTAHHTVRARVVLIYHYLCILYNKRQWAINQAGMIYFVYHCIAIHSASNAFYYMHFVVVRRRHPAKRSILHFFEFSFVSSSFALHVASFDMGSGIMAPLAFVEVEVEGWQKSSVAVCSASVDSESLGKWTHRSFTSCISHDRVSAAQNEKNTRCEPQ